MSAERRAEIARLIAEELQEDGSLEEGDIIRYWMTLCSVYSANGEGEEFGAVMVLDSDPSPSPDQRLGMMAHHKMQLSAIFTKILVQQEDDDE